MRECRTNRDTRKFRRVFRVSVPRVRVVGNIILEKCAPVGVGSLGSVTREFGKRARERVHPGVRLGNREINAKGTFTFVWVRVRGGSRVRGNPRVPTPYILYYKFARALLYTWAGLVYILCPEFRLRYKMGLPSHHHRKYPPDELYLIFLYLSLSLFFLFLSFFSLSHTTKYNHVRRGHPSRVLVRATNILAPHTAPYTRYPIPV